jgi:hypothetical protein
MPELVSTAVAGARSSSDKIAKRARLMTLVPEELWSAMVWLDESDDQGV